jgi:hypothetical protein
MQERTPRRERFPVSVSAQVLTFYLPACLGSVVVISLLMLTKRIPRWAGAVLVLQYAGFVVGGYFL